MTVLKIARVAAIGTAIQLLMSQTAIAETLKVSTFLPPKHAFNRMLEAWRQELSDKTDGELTVEIFPAGQLAPPPRQFDLVRSGGADVSVVLHGATPGRFALSELAGLPLVTPSAGSDSAITSRRLTELVPDYLTEEHAGTRVLWMAVTPPLMFHVKGFDPSNLDNFKGKRIRYQGVVWQKIIEAMGASSVPVPPAETADAMAKGVVDGATFPFEATIPFDLAPVSDFTLTPGIASASFSVVMGDHAYNRLSDEHKALIDATTGPDRAEAFGAMWDKGEGAGRAFMEKGGVQVLALEQDKLDNLRQTLASVVDEVTQASEASGLPVADFLNAYTK